MRRRGARVALASLALAAASVAYVPEAKAEDTAAIAAAVTTVTTLLAVDIAFTAYSVDHAGNNVEPSREWMWAQSVVAGAETVAMAIGGAAVAFVDEKDEGLSLIPIPVTIFVGTLSGFSSWSLASTNESLDDRMLLSLVGATNLAFTSAAIGVSARKRFLPWFLSIPQLTLMAPEAVLTAIKAGTDEHGRAGWITLSVWSGLLAVHGVASMIGKASDADQPSVPPDAVPTPVVPTGPDPVDPYYIEPPSAAPPPPVPPPPPPPLIVPTPIPAARGLAPGLSVVGLF